MADVFHLEAIRARHGDCLILHYGPEERPELILIDGGPSKVYLQHLRPRLEQLRQERDLGERDTLEFRMLMISHIDDDHIRGILELLQEERERKEDQLPPRCRFETVWLNSFDDLVGQGAFDLEDAARAAFRRTRDREADSADSDAETSRRAALAAAFGGHRDQSLGPG
ncbi:MAG: hypothetical protein MI919_12285, partial [Holophagales bacterium]|nr:hypothetical protein [Holophagales bacterium]